MATAIAENVAFYDGVFMRRVIYLEAGDVLPGHDHGRGHITLIRKGCLHVSCPVTGLERDLAAGDHLHVPARARHELTALIADSESWCIFSVEHPTDAI